MKKVIIKTFFCLLTLVSIGFPFKQSYYYYAKGILNLQNKDYKEAIGNFEKVIKIDPTAKEAYSHLAFLYILTGDKAKLKKLVENIKNFITDVEELQKIADLFVSLGEFEFAGEIYKKMYDLQPQNFSILLNLAKLSFNKSPEESKEYYKKYLELNPQDTTAYFELGVVEYKLGNEKEAFEIFKDISQKQPDNSLLKILSLELISSTTSFFDFDEEYVESLKKLPKKEFLDEYYLLIAIFYENKKDYRLAAKYLEKYIRKAKTYENSLYLKLAYYYFSQKKYKKAKNVLLKLKKHDEAANLMLFFIYFDLKCYKKAIEFLKEIPSTFFNKKNFYIAVCYDHLGDFNLTENYLLKAIEENPDDAEVLNYLGYLYADKNIKLDEAERMIKKALELDPTNYAYIDSLGWVYYRKEDYQKAEEFLLKAASLKEDPVVYEHVGDVKVKLGKYKEAEEFYMKALKINKKNKAVKIKLKSLKH